MVAFCVIVSDTLEHTRVCCSYMIMHSSLLLLLLLFTSCFCAQAQLYETSLIAEQASTYQVEIEAKEKTIHNLSEEG